MIDQERKVIVSVIIPMHNVDEFIEGCIISLLEGDFQDIEIICIDDGSTDTTASVVKRIQSTDTRIRLIAQNNQGVSAARNAGLNAAKGSYIAFVDADDWVSQDYIKTLYDLAVEKQADIVRCNFFTTRSYCPHRPFPDEIEFEASQVHENKKERDLVRPVWCALYKREICSIFDTGVQIGEDLLFNIRILSNHPDLVAWKCSKRMYAHHRRSTSLINTSGIEEHYIAFNVIANSLATLPVKKYATISAVKQALAFREHIEMDKRTEYRTRAKALMHRSLSILVRCRDIALLEKLVYIPFILSSKMYYLYRRKKGQVK